MIEEVTEMARWYGSLQNRLAECAKNPDPAVGMFVTRIGWSDRYPFEVVAVKDARHCTVRQMRWVITSGFSLDGSAEYEYYSDEGGVKAELFKKKDGRWVERIGKSHVPGGWALGYAERYYDPSF